MHEPAALNAIDANQFANDGASGIQPAREWRGGRFLAMVAGIVAFSLLIVAWQFGSVANGIRALQGYSVAPEHSVVSAGNVVAGQPVTVAFRLRSLTSGEVRILGARSDCSCVSYDGLPMTLGAKSEAEMQVSFTSSRQDVGQTLRHVVTLYLDLESPPVVLSAEATVVEGPEGAAKDASEGS